MSEFYNVCLNYILDLDQDERFNMDDLENVVFDKIMFKNEMNELVSDLVDEGIVSKTRSGFVRNRCGSD